MFRVVRVVGRVRVRRSRRPALAVFLIRLHRSLRWGIIARTVRGRCDASTAVLVFFIFVCELGGAVRELGRGVLRVLGAMSYPFLVSDEGMSRCIGVSNGILSTPVPLRMLSARWALGQDCFVHRFESLSVGPQVGQSSCRA
jgi:hypothetical protein